MRTLIKILGVALLIYCYTQYLAIKEHKITTDKDYIIDTPDTLIKPGITIPEQQDTIHYLNIKPIHHASDEHEEPDEPPDDISPDY